MPEDIGFQEWPDDIPLTQEQLEISTDRLGMAIDPRILPLIIDLNEEGFITEGSCQGDSPSHPHGTWARGRRNPAYIQTSFPLNMLTIEAGDRLKSIIEEHTNVPYRITGLGDERRGMAKVRIDFSGPI